MRHARFDSLVRELAAGSLTRRGVAQGFGGAVLASTLALTGLAETEAKRRRGKKRRKKRGSTRRGGNDRCQFTRCDGRCVNFETDPDNCGACGDACPDDLPCVAGLCVLALGGPDDDFAGLGSPGGVAVNADGVGVVADRTNERILRFQRGERIEFLGSFGERGEEDGQFLEPSGVAIDGDAIFVTDADRHRIQRFDLQGNFEAAGGSFGSGLGQFDSPQGIAIDPPTGELFVVDTFNHSVQRLAADFSPLSRIGREGNGNGEFSFPSGIAIDGDGDLVVADVLNHRIQVLDRDGNFIRAFGRRGDGAGEFNEPLSVAVDAAGDIFVVDNQNRGIQRFTGDGQFVKTFGRQGTGVGEFEFPFGIAVDSLGIITVTDVGSHPLQLFFPANVFAAGEGIATAKDELLGDRPARKQRRRTS